LILIWAEKALEASQIITFFGQDKCISNFFLCNFVCGVDIEKYLGYLEQGWLEFFG
jgi:hypothetical protein